MQILDILTKMGGVTSMASELGISETQATSGAEAMIPALLGGLKKQAQGQQHSSAGGLGALFDQLGGSSLLDNVLAPQPTDVNQGNGVLSQLFGSKDVSRAVAQNAASQTGLEPSLLKKMLPMVAMLVTGAMAKQQGSGASAPGGQSSGVLSGLLGNLMGRKKAGGGLSSLLDLDGDGNPLDDILGMIGKGLG